MAYTPTQSIPVAYQPLFGAFAESALLNLLRQWCKQPPQQMRMNFEIPTTYRAHAVRCQRIGQFVVDGEPLDVMVIHVRQLATWVYKPNVLHALAVRALRRWCDADFRAVVAYVAPDGLQWRMQLIMQEIESYRDPVRNTMRTRASVSPAQRMRWEMHQARVAAVPFEHWDALHAARASVTMTELKEAFMPIPTTPEEGFARAYRESIEAIDAYARRLQESANQVSNAERAKIYEQLAKLHQYAHQWEQAGQLLTSMMATTAVAQPQETSVSAPYSTTSGDAVEFGLQDIWRYRRPVAFVHLQQRYEVKQWIRIYTIILAKAIREHGDAFVASMNQRAELMSAPRRRRLTKDANDFKRGMTVEGWHCESDLSSTSIAMNITLIYEILGIPFDSFKVWVVDES
jgi:hypothetical protein